VEFVLTRHQAIADERLEIAAEEWRFLECVCMLYKDAVNKASGVNEYDRHRADSEYTNITTLLTDTQQELQPLRAKVSDITEKRMAVELRDC
jgi:peptidoglycan hydrolase CwlO-like protein